MGSYNETCMLSNLPILEGEKVFVMVLQRTPNDQRSRFKHYTYGDWSPTPICFVADYSGYGSVDKSTLDVEYKDIIPLFDDYLNFNKHIQKSNLPFWDFIDEVSKGHVSVKLYDGAYMPFSLAFISMEVLGQMLKEFKIGRRSKKATYSEMMETFTKAIWNKAIHNSFCNIRILDNQYGELGDLFFDMNQTPIVETESMTCFYGPLLATSFGDSDFDPLEHIQQERKTNIKNVSINNMLYIWVLQRLFWKAGKTFCIPSGSGQVLDFSATTCLEKIKKSRIKSLKEANNG